MAKYTHYAAALAPSKRKQCLAALEEPDLRAALHELFVRAMPTADVHLTHGATEQGKDLVIIQPQAYGEEVFGLVVKCGTLTGAAKGPIDMIISQACMAFDMPAAVPTRLDRPSVTGVWVVASGNITKGARDRIESQLPNFRPRFIDADDLDALFVDYYPEIYFHGQLLSYVDETAVALESDHLTFASTSARLSDVFVEPILLASEMDIPGDEYEIEQVLSDQKLRFGRISEALRSHRRILIVGEPGVGKSASLRKLTIDGLHQAAAQATDGPATAVLAVPLYIRASRLTDCADGPSLCERALPQEVPTTSFEVSAVYVDALDEVPSTLHQQVIENAVACASDLGAPLVVSSRNVDAVASTPDGFKRYEMLPFEFSQALEFFTKMVRNPDTLEELKDALEQVSSNLAMTPLSLLLLVQLAEEAEEIPATIGELYDRFTDEVLGKSDLVRGIESAFDYQIRKRFLAALSYDEFYQKGRLEVPADEFREYIEKHFLAYGYPPELIDEFVQGLERAEILSVKESVGFKHRSFLEYFCALQVVQEPERVGDVAEWAVQTYFDEEWSDVAFYYFGHRRLVPEGVLSRLVNYEGDDMLVRLRKFLLGRLLQAGWHTPIPNRVAGMRGALGYTGAVRADFVKIAALTHGSVPEIVADVAITILAERSFKSAILEPAGRQILDALPAADAPHEDWLAYVAILRALRRTLGDDDLIAYAVALEEAVRETHDPGLQARMILLATWALEDQPAAKKSLERKFRVLAKKYNESVRGVLPAPKKGWRAKRTRAQ